MMGWKVCELRQGLRPTRVWRCVEARVIERGWAQNSHFPNAVCAPGCWVPLATVAPGRMYRFVRTVRVMTPSSQVVLSFNGIMYLKWWCTACPRHSVHGRRSCPCFYPPRFSVELGARWLLRKTLAGSYVSASQVFYDVLPSQVTAWMEMYSLCFVIIRG